MQEGPARYSDGDPFDDLCMTNRPHPIPKMGIRYPNKMGIRYPNKMGILRWGFLLWG